MTNNALVGKGLSVVTLGYLFLGDPAVPPDLPLAGGPLRMPGALLVQGPLELRRRPE